MSGFDATPVELQVCGSMLAQISADVREQMSALQIEADDLFAGGWQGGAADGFTQCWQEWRAGASEVLAALQSMGELLGTTGRSYTAVDDQSADSISQLDEGL